MKYKTYFPYAIAVLIFFIISFLFVAKPVAEGKKVIMADITKYKGQSKELNDYKEKTGETALWTNSMFGGMPSYLIKTPPASKFNSFIHKILNLNHFRPVSFIFLLMVGFFIALLCFDVNPWISILGALAYGLSSYFFALIPAGHMSKVLALGYMPGLIGGARLAFRGKPLAGGAIFALFFALQMLVNHLQMTYYTFIILLIYGLSELIFAIKEKRIKPFLTSAAALIFFGLIAIGSNLRTLWTTYEYGEYSIRGKSELTTDAGNKTSGLDKDYATQWSYGIGESFTLLIPNFRGGASVYELSTDSETYKLLSQIQGKAQAKKTITQMPMYWGDQPFTQSTTYVGAVICLLFVLGMYVLKGRTKWWIFASTVVSLILAWGHNVPNITNFLLDHLPGYNKFRAVSSTLVIAQLTMPLMGILALAKMLKGEIMKEKLQKSLFYSVGITGGLALFFALFGKGMFSFEAASDQQYLAQGATQIVDAWQADRAMLLRKDSFRSLLFVLFAGGLLYLYLLKKVKLNYVIAGMGLLILVDMWPVDKRYLNNDDFQTKKEHKTPFTASAADQFILQDPYQHYRVLNLAVSTFQDASTSYFHKSIGGYHGAKWRRYQELYEQSMFQESQGIIGSLQTQNPHVIDATIEKAHTLNMLNTKYIIYNPNARPLVNTAANGNAWFVNNYQVVANADEEMAAIKTTNTKEIALVDERFEEFVEGKTLIPDSLARIELIEYRPDYLKYSCNANSEQLALFSEIYYPKGWIAKVDGKEVDHFRANYLLRALMVPAGEHTIEFSFEPRSYALGGKVAMASSWILFLTLVAAIALPYVKKPKE